MFEHIAAEHRAEASHRNETDVARSKLRRKFGGIGVSVESLRECHPLNAEGLDASALRYLQTSAIAVGHDKLNRKPFSEHCFKQSA